MAVSFNPNAAAGADSGIFGLPHGEEDAALVLIPVPWEATTSYGGGTSQGPSAILKASKQVDLYDLDVLKPYEAGIFCLPESGEVRGWNENAKAHARKVIEAADAGAKELHADVQAVNQASELLNGYVYEQTRRLLGSGKIPGIVGGDHSVPFGAIRAVGEISRSFGVLHFDAHLDERDSYEGFEWSHASIMRNVLDRVPSVTKLVQVGIRDVCEEEVDYVSFKKDRVDVFYDRENARRKLDGVSWSQIAREVVANLPHDVWVSFDIDGLDPKLCPHTGTPVPGGLEFHEANQILSTLVRSGRRILGFDLNEVAPDLDDHADEWDANVGARLLYKLCAWTLASQSKVKLQIC